MDKLYTGNIKTKVNDVLVDFYKQEQGNRLTSFSVDGLIFSILKCFDACTLKPPVSPPDQAIPGTEVPISIEDF